VVFFKKYNKQICVIHGNSVLLIHCCFLFVFFYWFYFKRENKFIYLGKTTPTYESNCRELIKIVDDFLSQSSEINERLTENFVNGKFFLYKQMK